MKIPLWDKMCQDEHLAVSGIALSCSDQAGYWWYFRFVKLTKVHLGWTCANQVFEMIEL